MNMAPGTVNLSTLIYKDIEYKWLLILMVVATPDARGKYISVWIKVLNGVYDDKLDWPVTVTIHLQLLNWFGNHVNHEKVCH